MVDVQRPLKSRQEALDDSRRLFLLKLYKALNTAINTHLLVVWQSIGILVGAFALLGLAEKQIISLDIAVTLVVLISAWLLAHVYDASFWYNRNLAIISNIERQFLRPEDEKDICHYFVQHRSGNMINHFRIQWWLGFGIGASVLIYHWVTFVGARLYLLAEPAGYRHLWSPKLLPYIVFVAGALFLVLMKRTQDRNYSEFLEQSPGIAVVSDIAPAALRHDH